MKLGVVGLPNVGKSSLFNAITKGGAASENYPFKYTFYKGKSSLRVGQEDECYSTHYSGWWLTYRLHSVLKWLLAQRKKEVSDEQY